MYFETSLESVGECEADEEQEGPLIGLTSSTWSGHEGLPGKSEYSIAYDTAQGKILNGGHASKGKFYNRWMPIQVDQLNLNWFCTSS